jgi:hypothetical protein
MYGFGVHFPKLLVLVFPSVIEERLLRVVPRDDSKPLLWLDVDGVVNGSEGSDEQQTIACFGWGMSSWPVRFSPQIVRELNRLSSVCDVHWATGWGKRARFRLAPAIGLNDFNVWNDNGSLDGKGTLDKVVNFNRPLIWIDDELDDRGKKCFLKQAPKVRAAFKNHLLLAPCLVETNPKKYLDWDDYGLTMRHIAQIDAFLATHGVVANKNSFSNNEL